MAGKKLMENRIRKSVKQVIRCDVLSDKLFLEEVRPEVAPPYDVILSSLCLEAAVPDLESFITVLRRLNKLLRTGGGLILVGFTQCETWTVKQTDYHYTSISEEELQKALKDAVFGKVDMRTHSEKINFEYEHDKLYCLAAEKF